MRDWEEAARDFDDAAVLKVDRFVTGEHRLEAGIDQEGAQHDHRPVESLDQGVTSQNEDAAQDKRAQNAPKEDTHLKLGWNAEIAENDNKHEDVVHAQRIFDEVASQKFDGFLVTELKVDPGVEAKR